MVSAGLESDDEGVSMKGGAWATSLIYAWSGKASAGPTGTKLERTVNQGNEEEQLKEKIVLRDENKKSSVCDKWTWLGA